MKKMIFVICFLINALSSFLICDEKDSVEKYQGTMYIGDIHKVYDYLPDIIIDKKKIVLLNTITLYPLDNNVSLGYEIGAQLLFRQPRWLEIYEGWLAGWARVEFGPYFKIFAYDYTITTFGMSMQNHFDDSQFYFGFNEGILYGTFYSGSMLRTGLGLELELIFGYKFDMGGWLITPEAKLNMSYINSIDYSFRGRDFTIPKFPVQLGINICKTF